MVYKTMFPRNPRPEEFTNLIEKFKNVQVVHDHVKAHMIAVAKFAHIWVKFCHSKIDFDDVLGGPFEVLKKESKP
jgi:hypothetical protein